MSVSALPIKLTFDPNGDPSGIGEFVSGSDHISSGLLQLSGCVFVDGTRPVTGELSAIKNLTVSGSVSSSNHIQSSGNIDFAGNISGTGSWGVNPTTSGVGPTPTIPTIVLTTDSAENKGTRANGKMLTPDSGSHDVQWDTEIFKNSTYFSHSNSVNPHRVTITYAGLYEITTTMSVSSADGRIIAEQYVVVNNSPPSAGAYKPTMYIYDRSLTGGDEASAHLVSVHQLAASDYVVLRSQKESSNDGLMFPIDKECMFCIKKLA